MALPMTDIERQRRLAEMTRNKGQKWGVDAGTIARGQFGPNSPSGMAASGYAKDAPDQGGSIEGRQRISDSQRDYANQLRGSKAPKGMTAGPYDVYYGPNWGDSLANAGKQVMGGYMAGQANKEDRDIDKERQSVLTKAKEKEEAAEAAILTRQAEQDALKAKQYEDTAAAKVEAANLVAGAATDKEKRGKTATDAQIKLDADNRSEDRGWAEKDAERKQKYAIALQELKNRKTASETFTEGKTTKEREKFSDGGSKAAATQALLAGYDDGYSANVATRTIPGATGLAHFLERTSPMTKSDEDSALWWSDAGRRELKPRHELFGSAFTANEEKIYDATTFSKTDDPSFIREQLERRLKLEQRATEQQAAEYLMKGYDPERVLLRFGDVVDVEQLMIDMESGAFKKRIKASQEENRQAVQESKKESTAVDNTAEKEKIYIKFPHLRPEGK
jgi:hypothetical protein